MPTEIADPELMVLSFSDFRVRFPGFDILPNNVVTGKVSFADGETLILGGEYDEELGVVTGGDLLVKNSIQVEDPNAGYVVQTGIPYKYQDIKGEQFSDAPHILWYAQGEGPWGSKIQIRVTPLGIINASESKKYYEVGSQLKPRDITNYGEPGDWVRQATVELQLLDAANNPVRGS